MARKKRGEAVEDAGTPAPPPPTANEPAEGAITMHFDGDRALVVEVPVNDGQAARACCMTNRGEYRLGDWAESGRCRLPVFRGATYKVHVQVCTGRDKGWWVSAGEITHEAPRGITRVR